MLIIFAVKSKGKYCFKIKSEFTTEDYFLQHMNITINKIYFSRKLYTKYN